MEPVWGKLSRHALLAALLVGALWIAVTYRDFGSNWDDGVQAQYGELVVDYFRSGFQDTRCNRFLDLRFYGPLAEVIPALLYGRDGSGKYEIRHLFVALISLMTIPALVGYCRLFRVPMLPVFAVLALVTMPRFYGHAFNNSKDMPFACLVTWSLYAFASFFAQRRFTSAQVVACGVAVGLTLSVRPGGLLLLGVYFAGAAGLSYLTAGAKERAVFDRARVASLLVQTVCMLVLAWVLMIAAWPWAHERPIANPIEAMRVAASFTSSYPVLFDGTMWKSTELPWYYVVKFLLITTPPLALFLALFGIGSGFSARRRSRREAFLFSLTLLWLGWPLAAFAVLRPNVYDGIRHFLFVLPSIAVLAGLGASWLYCRLRSRSEMLAVALPIALLLLAVKDLVILHPYQTTYFNFTVGGLRGADGRYDTEYWLTSYKEALEWVNQQAASSGHGLSILVGGDGYIRPWVSYYAANGVQTKIVSSPPARLELPDGVDYYIASKRYHFDRGFPRAPVVYSIGREGAVFTVIKGRKSEAAASKPHRDGSP